LRLLYARFGFARAAELTRRQVAEADKVDVRARSVLGYLEQVDDAVESRFAPQLGSYVRELDLLDRVHRELAVTHRVALARGDLRPHPDSHAARDLAAPHGFAQPFREDHAASLAEP